MQIYDRGLILIKCTKGSYKPDNHKNPFTNGHKQAIHRKNTKTHKHMEDEQPYYKRNVCWETKCYFSFMKVIKLKKKWFLAEWKMNSCSLMGIFTGMPFFFFFTSLAILIGIWSICIAFINSALLHPKTCLIKIFV